jgi:hypothetical protein
LIRTSCDTRPKRQPRAKPDFIFPGSKEYRNERFNAKLLVMLGAKSTLKERWRQLPTEAAKTPRKHLCTLEPSISRDQANEIAKHSVQLVIPESFHQTYADAQKKQLWTISEFVEFVSKMQK